MTVARKRSVTPAPLLGKEHPRIAPPVPVKHELDDLVETAKGMGIELMPWQKIAARYITALGADKRHLYPEVCIVVARQNGKTTLMQPIIIRALRAGKRIMHIAQTRELPRQMFNVIADALSEEPDLFPKRRGKTIWPRYGAGQEEISLTNGGYYRIASERTGGARGWPNDMVIIDELREMTDWRVVEAAQPTTAMSEDPQMIYLSNAGTKDSVILNWLRDKGTTGEDPRLAYLEWSSAPERTLDDRAGWAEANPALGHFPQVERNLEDAMTKPGPLFETERLCRWVATIQRAVVLDVDWQRLREPLPDMHLPCMGLAVDPEVRRASAVVAWVHEGQFYVRSFAEAGPASAIDLDAFAKDLDKLARKHRIRSIGFDPWYDRDLARHFKTAKKIAGADYAAACTRFAQAVESGQLHHDDESTISADLAYTVRRETANAWVAVRADEERPTTASLAAIRAVWLASAPRPTGGARIY